MTDPESGKSLDGDTYSRNKSQHTASYNMKSFKIPKGVTRSRHSKKDIQCNDQKYNAKHKTIDDKTVQRRPEN